MVGETNIAKNGSVDQKDSEKPQQLRLLHLVQAKYNKYKEYRSTRCMYVLEVGSVPLEELIDFHRNWVADEKRRTKVTGLAVLINKAIFLHVIETDNLRNLLKNIPDGIGKSVVCSVTNEIYREYPMWAIREATISKEGQTFDGTSLAVLVFESLKAMLELGRQLSLKTDQSAAVKLFMSQQREIMMRIPAPDRLEYFLSRTKELFTLTTFVDFFYKPVVCELESEVVWPHIPTFHSY